MTLPLEERWILIAEDEAMIALDLKAEFEQPAPLLRRRSRWDKR